MHHLHWLLPLLLPLFVSHLLLADAGYLNRCESVFFDKYYPGAVPFKTYQIRGVTFLETDRLQIKASQSNFEVYEKASGREVGHMGLFYFKHEPTAHLPIYTNAEFHGLGYASEFRFAVLKWVFLSTSIKKIFAQIRSDNQASLSLNIKLGFKEFSRKNGIVFFHLQKEDFFSIDAQFFLNGDFTKPRSQLLRTPIPNLRASDTSTRETLIQLITLVRNQLSGGADFEKLRTQNPLLAEAMKNLKMPKEKKSFDMLFDQIDPNLFKAEFALKALKYFAEPYRGSESDEFYQSFSKLCSVIENQLFEDAASRQAIDYTYFIKLKE